VHQSPCVIGDLNHSGILAGEDMTVALIDADSFQLQSGGKTYPCLVGVPEFTPPELHGLNLKTEARTKFHDQFGLGVVIFQLLFMGRHPYMGRQHGTDLPLEKLIAQNRFAYSRRRNVGVSPPPGVATLNEFPIEIAEGFERAFGLSPSNRPSAREWVELLEMLERGLSRCGSNSLHFYPTASKGCPWCRMDAALGISLFVPAAAQAPRISVELANFDVERIWQAVKSVPIYDANSLQPKLSALPSLPSPQALSATQNSGNKIVAAVVLAASIGLLLAIPRALVLSIIGAIFAWFIFQKKKVPDPSWATRYSECDARWAETLDRWRKSLGIARISTLRQALETTIVEYRKLPTERSASITSLAIERKQKQLYNFLDQLLIKNAAISGIGAAKKVTLASFGIETAADVTYQAVTSISGFGSVTASSLVAWRAQQERRFVYNPAPSHADKQAELQIEVAHAAKRNALARGLIDGLGELQTLAANVTAQLNSASSTLSKIAIEKTQLEVDLAYLGVIKPSKTSGARMTTAHFTTAQTSTTSIPSCPRCGGQMVRRTARRGMSRGRGFWGCSRYPVCKGTRI
jgi:DNA-binding helix-hairpin-helix protein with protein kinase domain